MSVEDRESAPKPLNFEAMAAAWNDPIEFAKQKAIYNAQLIDEGCAPLWSGFDGFNDRLPERFDDRMDLQ